MRKALTAVIVLGLAVTGCDYIVPPISFDTPTPAGANLGWASVVTGVTEVDGALHVELSIRNNNNDWSAMDVAASSASVTDAAGKKSSCAKTFVGTSVFVNNGGWYLPPGFIMKGYTGGSADKPETQLLYVECAGVAKAAGEKLTINYSYITGPFNYYRASAVSKGTFNLDLDKVVADAKYPIAEKTSSVVVNKSDAIIPGINDCTVQLTGVKRTATGFEFSWESKNPGLAPAYVHIGIPPVIGQDGILYGFYQSPHLSDAPITPAGDKAEWSTTASVPADGKGFYVLVPVESQQQKYFVDHVLDITSD